MPGQLLPTDMEEAGVITSGSMAAEAATGGVNSALFANSIPYPKP